MSLPTLVLSSWMIPQRIVSWQDGITLWFLGKVDVLEEYEEIVASPSIEMYLPAVVRLRRHVAGGRRAIRFSRANVFSRDGYACQYCGEKKTRGELSFDHVVPRMHGERTGWENIVTACRPCNLKKRNRTPDQAGMMLRRRPARPTGLPIEPMSFGGREIPPEWRHYCPGAQSAA